MIIQYLFSDPFIFFAWVVAFLIGLTIHEFSHALVAYKLGDSTAKYAGRITLNPLAHLDLFGTILLFVVGFGWGKPVPFNPYNLRNQKYGPLLIAIAGPLSNLVIALIFGLALRFFVAYEMAFGLILLFSVIVFLNIILAVFNLLPIPPLDGSKILFAILPDSMNDLKMTLERYGLFILIFFLFFLLPIIFPIIFNLSELIMGQGAFNVFLTTFGG
jgi:Zn-dependent protease